LLCPSLRLQHCMKSIFAGHPLHPPRSVRLLPPLGCERDRARRPHLHTPALPALPQVSVGPTKHCFCVSEVDCRYRKDQQIFLYFLYTGVVSYALYTSLLISYFFRTKACMEYGWIRHFYLKQINFHTLEAFITVRKKVTTNISTLGTNAGCLC
jgi:hypothetical protein